MSDLLKQLGVRDFLEHVLPGFLVLASFAVWIPFDFSAPFFEQQVIAVAIGLTLAYAAGLLLAAFNRRAEIRYHQTARARSRLRQPLQWLYSFPSPRFNRSVVAANLAIAEQLELLAGGRFSSLASPWDRLVIYRALVADLIGDRGRIALEEAERLNRSSAFAMGVALALLLAGAVMLLRLLLALAAATGCFATLDAWHGAATGVPTALLALGPIVALGASFALRDVAVRTWELERYVTAGISRRVPLDGSPAPAPGEAGDEAPAAGRTPPPASI